MIWAVWGALAVLGVVLIAGSVHVAREGLAAWRSVRRLMRVLGAGSDMLSARADEIARKTSGSGAAAVRAGEAIAHLQRSLAYARVIADAAGDVRATLTGLQGAVPRK